MNPLYFTITFYNLFISFLHSDDFFLYLPTEALGSKDFGIAAHSQNPFLNFGYTAYLSREDDRAVG